MVRTYTPYHRFRARRTWRRWQKNAQEAPALLQESWYRYVRRRLRHWKHARRFVLTWIGLFMLLAFGLTVQIGRWSDDYIAAGPVSGGSYTEGLVGEIGNFNPIFPQNNVTATQSRLVFNGLLQGNSQGDLTPDLAAGWRVDETGTTYHVDLRQGIKWHDGEELDAEDVVFTFNTIQVPDTQSPLRLNWKDVEITATGKYAVEFMLPNPFTPFPNLLTTGIIPEHILGDTPPDELRTAEFSQVPIGTGPFKATETSLLEEGTVTLYANDQYFRGRPKLDRFVIKTYATADALAQAYRQGRVSAAAGVKFTEISSEDGGLESLGETRVIRAKVSNEVIAFFNNTNPILQDGAVRRALTQGTDRAEIRKQLEFEVGRAEAPLLSEHLGYAEDLVQHPYDPEAARKILDDAGWAVGENGIRVKDGNPLVLELLSAVEENDATHPIAAEELRKQWQELGVQVSVQYRTSDDLLQTAVRARSFDVVILGITLGSDPDVFSYWHSSQSDHPGLNISQYSSPLVDEALEAGRTRIEQELRNVKYRAFLTAWRDDAPSIVLFRPYYLYVHRSQARNIDIVNLVDTADRLSNVHEWTIRQELQKKIDIE